VFIELVSNADHYDAGFRTNHGFEAVLVEITDSAGTLVWAMEIDLAGTPDPDVVIEPDVIGRTILLTFTGQENSSTGGFAELAVFAEA
jgi:hypothetical protein